jgi:opacity protein-like surface antigen
MIMMKKFFATCLFATALTVSAHAENVAIGGSYKVEGTNINGTTYSGDATITLTSETTCEIHWTTGTTTSDGICMRNDDSFGVAYQLGDAVGMVIYKVAADGTLNGLWTVAGNGGAGTEVLTPVR